MLKLSFCDYNVAYILVNRTIGITAAGSKNSDKRNKQVTYKNCAPFTDYISELNNSQIDNTKDLDDTIPMHNVIEFRGNHEKTAILWQYLKDDSNYDKTDSKSFKFKARIKERSSAAGNTKDAKIAV